ncbi:MAG: aldo/keto reductase [Candidatus Brocadiia bacterium]
MEHVRLGDSQLEVSRLCLGTWNMSGGEGWGPEDDQNSIRIIREVLDRGFNFIDSAHGYGKGHSEEVLGKALDGRRDDAIVSTKIVQCDPSDVEAQLDAALKRLRSDYVDIYIVHWPRPSVSLEDFMGEMVKMKEKGKAREIGASNFNLEQMKIALEFGAISLQPPFNALWRIIDEDVLPFCRKNQIGVTPYSPLAQGLLTGRYTRGEEKTKGGPRDSNLLFKEPNFSRAKEGASVVDDVADEIGATSAQTALAWVLQTDGITAPIVGVSRMGQWEDNVQALDIELTGEQYDRISRAGLEVWNECFTDDDTMWGWKPK